MHLAALHGGQEQARNSELVDALVAKDKAIRLLRPAIDQLLTAENQAMILAATVFFINLDLIDSGKGGWQAHIEAASTLMSSLRGPLCTLHRSLAAPVEALAADCLTYIVLGSAISGVARTSWGEHHLSDFFSILKRAEAYSYHCCPPEILRIILLASRLCGHNTANHASVEAALSLLHQAQSLDVVEWVYTIRGLAVQDDLDTRVNLALAHRATACLYILLAVPEAADGPDAVNLLVDDVLGHLGAVPADHLLVKGTVWPTFVAGAQADDPVQRAWCMDRMEAVLSRNPWTCPWGYVRSAMEMLQHLWAARDRAPAEGRRTNWLQELKSMRDKCLIV